MKSLLFVFLLCFLSGCNLIWFKIDYDYDRFDYAKQNLPGVWIHPTVQHREDLQDIRQKEEYGMHLLWINNIRIIAKKDYWTKEITGRCGYGVSSIKHTLVKIPIDKIEKAKSLGFAVN